MFSWLAIILIAVANGLTGWQLWRTLSHVFESRDSAESSLIETLVVSQLLGATINGWLAVILAEFGRFTPTFLLLIWLIPLSALLLFNQRQISKTTGSRPGLSFESSIILFLWLPLACLLYFRPHNFVQGAADAGVYISIAANLAETGSLIIQDEVLASLDPALYPNLLRIAPRTEIEPYLYKLGFYIEEIGSGEITPQFYALHPVLQGIAYLIGGVYAALLLSGLWSILGVLAAFLVLRDLGNRYVHWIALPALSLNAIQVWFARYPTTEVLTQALIWIGVWGFGRILTTRQPRYAILSGLTLGAAIMTRIDAIFLVILPLFLILWLMLRGKRSDWRVATAFLLPFSALTLHTLIHGWVQSRPYFISIYGSEFRYNPSVIWLFVVIAIALALIISLVIWRREQLWQFWQRHNGRILNLGALSIVLLTFWAWFLRPQTGEVRSYISFMGGGSIPIDDTQNLLRLAWYFSPIGIWLGALGSCVLLRKLNRRNVTLLLVGALFSLLYLWRIRATPSQIYSMRRYVPVTLPFLIMTGAAFNAWLISSAKRWQQFTGVGLTILWLGGFLWLARGFISQVDHVGQIEQIATISEQLEPRSILLFNDSIDPRHIGQAEFLGVPLRFLHGHAVFALRDTGALDSKLLSNQIDRWQSDGYSIYLADVDTLEVHDWPLPQLPFAEEIPYRVAFQQLETPFDRRPTALIDIVWQGTFKRLTLIDN